MLMAAQNSTTDASRVVEIIYPCMKYSEPGFYNASNETDGTNMLNDVEKSLETYYRFAYISQGIAVSFLEIVGILMNLFIIILFNRRTIWATVNYYIIALALWDMALLGSGWFLQPLLILIYGRVQFWGKLAKVLMVAYTFSNISMIGCVWITIALTVERYMAVCHVLKHRMINTSKRAKIIVLGTSISALSFAIPRYLELGLYKCYDPRTHEIHLLVSRSKLALNTNDGYFLYYRVFGGLMFQSVGPLAILIVLTFRTIQVLVRASRRRRSQLGNEQAKRKRWRYGRNRDSGVTVVLVLVMVKFVLCYTMPILLDIMEAAMKDKQFKDQVIVYLVDINNILVVFHSATNFIVYIVFGARVRKEVRVMFCGQTYSRRNALRVEDISLFDVRSLQNESNSIFRFRNTIRFPCNNNNIADFDATSNHNNICETLIANKCRQ